MRSFAFGLALVVLLSLSLCLAHADTLVNAGFETGDLTGWTQYLPGLNADVVTNWTGNTLTYTPPGGYYFLSLGGARPGWQSTNAATVSQHVNLNAGQTLSGFAAYDNASGTGSWAAVLINNDGTGLQTFPWSASDLPGLPYGPNYQYLGGTSSPWMEWQYTAPVAGSYTVWYCADGTPGITTAYGLFDIQTPEPGSLALVLMGLPGLAWLRRRRRG